MENKPSVIDIQDIISWAYCPQLYYWQSHPEVVKPRKTGEALYKEVVYNSLAMFYQLFSIHKEDAISKAKPDDIVLAFWRTILLKWGLDSLLPQLLEYKSKKLKLKTDFQMKYHDYEFYSDAHNLNSWEREFENLGLNELLNAIEDVASDKGIVRKPLRKPSVYFAPIGLAEAFSRSFETFTILWNTIDLRLNKVYINKPVVVRSHINDFNVLSDLGIILGSYDEVTRGRPKKNPIQKYAVRLVYFSFQLDPPLMNELLQDIKYWALNCAEIITDQPNIEYIPTEIQIIHILSGSSQIIPIKENAKNDFLLSLETVAKAFIGGIKAGAFLPRSIQGTDLCQSCEYYNYCYSSDGSIVIDQNLFESQFQDNEDAFSFFRIALGNQDKNGIFYHENILNTLLSFMEDHPSVSPTQLKSLISFYKDSTKGLNINDKRY